MASLSPIFKPEVIGKEESRPEESVTVVSRGEEEVEELKRIVELLRAEESKLVKDEVSQQLQQQLAALESEFSKLDDLYKLRSLLVTLEQVREANNAIQHLLSLKSSKSKLESDLRLIQAVDQFENIRTAFERSRRTRTRSNRTTPSERDRTRTRRDRTCPRDSPLAVYVEKVLVHWDEELVKLLTPRFEAILDSLHWPVTDSLLQSPVTLSVPSFDTLFIALLKLDIRPLFVVHDDDDDDDDPLIHVSLPIEIMIKPLKKKFFFHFMKPSRTNQIEKPEWYLTCVLNWMKDSAEFLDRNVEPLLKVQEKKSVPGRLQFVAGLLALVRMKLKNDLLDLVDDERNFSHTFDEVFLFVKELDSNVLEGQSLFLKQHIHIFSLFSKDPFFGQLMKLERRKSSEYVDSILESRSAWNGINSLGYGINSVGNGINSLGYGINSLGYEEDLRDLTGEERKKKERMNQEEEELIVTEAGDNFVILIQSIIERSEYIRDVRHKKAFLDLILEVVDDFRLRLSQLVRSGAASNEKSVASEENCVKWPFCVKYFGILNTLHYLVHVLDEWKDSPPFCEGDVGEEDPLEEMVSLLTHMVREMQGKIVDSLITQFSVKLYKYSTLRWQWMKSTDEQYLLSGSQIFHFLSTALQKLQSSLSSTLYQPICRNISSLVSSLFLKDVILREKNSFNSEGAAKIHKDVKHLLSLFKSFMKKPEPFLAEILEAASLLSLSKGAVLLLQEALESGDGEQCLKDVHVETLPEETVRAVLKKRLFD